MTRPLLNEHLSHDDFLHALVDIEDLDPGRREHLHRCRACHDKLERLSRRFSDLGRMAARLAPEPQRSFRLPSATRAARWRLRPLWAAGLAAVLILLLRWNGTDRMLHLPAGSQPIADSHHELTLAVDALVQNALPPAYQALAAVADPPVNEDLFDWVIPPLDDETETI